MITPENQAPDHDFQGEHRFSCLYGTILTFLTLFSLHRCTKCRFTYITPEYLSLRHEPGSNQLPYDLTLIYI
jgi:hypothetical protein